MTPPVLATMAVVLDRKSSGENWMRTTCFSAAHGALDCLERVSLRNSAKTPPVDLFDEVSLLVETRNQGRTWFFKEAAIERRRTGLGRSYEALSFACRFARLLIRNPVHEESRPAVFALLKRALDAWEITSRPDCIYFKSLFLLARDEGYPVQQDWLSRLTSTDREAAGLVLSLPAAEQAVGASAVGRLIQELEAYLRHHTEITVEPL